MAELEQKYPKHHEYLWTCDCGDKSHFVVLTWDDEDPTFRYLELHDYFRPITIWGKVKQCWKIIRGTQEYVSLVLLDEKTTAEMIEVMSKYNKKPMVMELKMDDTEREYGLK